MFKQALQTLKDNCKIFSLIIMKLNTIEQKIQLDCFQTKTPLDFNIFIAEL